MKLFNSKQIAEDTICKIKKFAWFPTTIQKDGVEYKVWLEKYISIQIYTYNNFRNGKVGDLGWIEIGKQFA